MSIKLEIEGERRKRGRTYDYEDSVIREERDKLRCLVEGKIREGSSSMKLSLIHI